MDTALSLRKVLGNGLKEHEVLKPYTMLKVGGVADFFYEAHTIEQLVAAAKVACDLNLPYFILGGGSQIMISDYGFPGLVIRNLTSRISFITEQSQAIVESGVNTARLVMEAASRDMGGMEFLATVPGTIGGALYSNTGNFGFVMASFVRSVTVFIPPGSLKTYKSDWLEAGYVNTRIKTTRESQACPAVVLAIKLQLQRYKSQEIMRKIAYYQKFAQSGFVLFKNPSGQPLKLGDDPETIERSAQAVLRRLNPAKLSLNHARLDPNDPNRMINKGKARAADMRQFIEQLKTIAAEQAGILLEEAFEYVGKWE